MTRVNTLLDLTRPLFNALDSCLMLTCALVCIYYLRRRFDAGLLLIAVSTLISAAITAIFATLCFQREWGFSWFSDADRQALLLATGVVYPFRVVTLPLGIVLLARGYFTSLPPPLPPKAG